MIYIDKDPSLNTLLEQEALKARGFYKGELDNWRGNRHRDAHEAFRVWFLGQPKAAYPDVHREKDPTFRTLLQQEALAARKLYTGELDNWKGPRQEDAYEAFRLGIAPQPMADPPNLHRDISARGIELVKHFEGLYLKAYLDSVGVWTIGWGHTGLTHKDGTVKGGRVVTLEEAEALLRHDMDFFEGRVSRFITVPMNDDEYAALVSFDFNTGGLGDSTLRRLLNVGDRAGAADQFLRWDKGLVDGRMIVLPGLVRRRKSERNLFLGKKEFIVPSR